jgi:hypothetical protein
VGLERARGRAPRGEEQLGRRLPAALRERLLVDNGGDIVVRLEGGEDEHWQLWFLETGDLETVEVVWDP